MNEENQGKEELFQNNLQEGLKSENIVDTLNATENIVDTLNAATIKKDSKEMGYDLVKISLFIVAGFLLLLILSFVFFKRMDITTDIFQASKMTDSLSIEKTEKIVNIAIGEREKEREFILKISQIVLLNLLLPIITGTIGFIFGSKSASSKDEG
jgi:hypothetical protein